MSRFGNGSNSNGQFWFGGNTFPGFLYKKNVGVGGRRSTKFAAGGNTTCNTYQYLYNKYKPGQGGVGASSIANRRAKNRLASVWRRAQEIYDALGVSSRLTSLQLSMLTDPAKPLAQYPALHCIDKKYGKRL